MLHVLAVLRFSAELDGCSQLAAQQHELTQTRHYETLLLARESSSMNSELSSNIQTNTSLQRLAQNLRLLLRSLAGEEDPESAKEEDDKPLEELADFIGDETRDDWAVERESEIARLQKENEELRRMLGIDPGTAQQMGWTDEVPDHRPVLHILKATMANAQPQETWVQRSPPQVPGNAAPAPQQNIPLQRTIEFQPGMRAAGTLRRPSMLRGRGSAPFWGPTPPAWQGGGSGLDLAG